MSENEISRKLIGSRKELLDIGLRNAMINFRSGQKSLAVVDERSQDVFHLLVTKETSMVFGHVTEDIRKEADTLISNEEGEQQEDAVFMMG